MYNLTIDEALESVQSTRDGLSYAEAKARLEKNGKNQIQEKKKKSLFMRILEQLKNALVIMLLFAALASIATAIIEKSPSELIDAGLILVIVILNTIIGVVQESKAEEAVDGLKDMTKPYAKVVRNGKVVKVKTEELVLGDIVVLEAGDIVPADLRLIETASLKIEDAALTGESLPTEKTCLVIEGRNLPLGDRDNMAFMGSIVSYGRGKGVVVACGMQTEMGKIADVLHEESDMKTPLTKRLDKTTQILSVIILTISALKSARSWWR